MIGTGITNINKMRTILSYADEEDIEKVKNDELSIDTAWKSAKEIKQRIEDELKKESKFNKTNDNIEWAYWTWNPVTGCKHGCPYCYARDIANRFYKEKFEPTFKEKRLAAPQNTPIPKKDEIGEHNVFVCSMADLFGDWVPDEWIESVFKSIEESPEWWNYLFLTKNPKKYLNLNFPKQCWIGATADTQQRADEAINVFKKLKEKKINNVLFLSCEPLMEKIVLPDNYLDWLIIGGRSRSSGMPEGQPEWEWVESLLLQARKFKIKTYFKPNLTIRPKEYPIR